MYRGSVWQLYTKLHAFTSGQIITYIHIVVRLVESLHYKPEGRGFDSRWGSLELLY